MKVGEALKRIRHDLGKTQVQVCEKLGLSQTYLSQIESGSKEASPAMMRRICKYYGVPPAILAWKSLDRKDVPKNKQKAFDTISPAINNLIDEFMFSSNSKTKSKSK